MDYKFIGGFIHMKENKDFVVSMNNGGQKYFLLVVFFTPMSIMIDGKRMQTRKNACVLIKPNTEYEYTSIKGSFLHNYVIFECDEQNLYSQFDVPCNKVFYLQNPEKMEEDFGFITWAFTDVLGHHEKMMGEALERIFVAIEKEWMLCSPKSFRDRQMINQLTMLRQKVQNDPGEWNVNKMAQAVYLTRSYFSVVYRKQFGVTPVDDLKQFTIKYAEKLLVETKETIGDIAQKCGYCNQENFIRLFRKVKGVTPNRYRMEKKETKR